MDIVFHALSSNIPEGSGSTPSNHVETALVCEENKKGPSSNFDLISNQILITNVSTIFKVLNQLVLEKKGRLKYVDWIALCHPEFPEARLISYRTKMIGLHSFT